MNNRMIQVIPAILEQTLEDIKKKVKRIRPLSGMIQLDVMDGEFVPNTTFQEAHLLATLPIDMEVHLMIERPILALHQWALPNVRRLIIHQEAAQNMAECITIAHGLGKALAVALNPETSTFTVKDYINKIDMIVMMGVNPGFSGQQFQKDILEKIKEVKHMRPDLLVEVDGGVNMENRDMIVAAGADILAAATAIWKSKDIAKTITALRG